MKACNCRKEFAFVHFKCLKEWLELTAHQFCDICGFNYIIEKGFKTRWEWFSDNTEEFETGMEMLAKTVNILHCLFLGLVVCSLVKSIIGRTIIPQYILAIILSIRFYNIIRIWFEFVVRLRRESQEWEKSNFTIHIFANPKRGRSKA